jgi:hypothetical protein
VTRYLYLDGSANEFTVAPDRLVYNPVRPEDSSTGMYSGGEPADVVVTPEQFAALEELIARLIGDTAHHIADRTKGSGLVIAGDRRTLVAMQSPHKAALEKALRALLPEACTPAISSRSRRSTPS